MSQPLESTRGLGEITYTRAYIEHPSDGHQVLPSEIESITIYAWYDGRPQPFWISEAIDPNAAEADPIATMYDEVQTVENWAQDGSTGPTFTSEIPYGGDTNPYLPKAGATARLEFIFAMTDGNLVTLKHWATYERVRAIATGNVS